MRDYYNVYHNPTKKVIKEYVNLRSLVKLLFTMYEKDIIQVDPSRYGQSLLDLDIRGLINAVEAEGNIIINRIF